MAKPKLTLLIDPTLRGDVLSHEGLATLRELTEVTLYDGPPLRNAQPSAWLPLLQDAEILLNSWGSPRIDAAVMGAAPKLRAIVYLAGTVKAFVTDAVWDRGVRVFSCGRAIGDSVAEFVVGQIIVARRDAFRQSAAMRLNQPVRNTDATVREVWKSTVGLVSFGNIGKRVCQLLQPFGPREVLVFDPFASAETIAAFGARKVELDELMRRSDVVSLHVPNLPETKGLISGEMLRLMRDDAILINTARGDVIDEAALIAELQKGRLYALLDVTSPEPAAPDSPLRSLPNVVLTPHTAGPRSHRIGEQGVEEVRRFLAGEPAVYEMTRERLAVTA